MEHLPTPLTMLTLLSSGVLLGALFRGSGPLRRGELQGMAWKGVSKLVLRILLMLAACYLLAGLDLVRLLFCGLGFALARLEMQHLGDAAEASASGSLDVARRQLPV